MLTNEEKAAKYDKFWTAYQKQNKKLQEAYAFGNKLVAEATAEVEKVRTAFRESLRDRFAAAALTGILANGTSSAATDKEITGAAFIAADVMLEARELGS